MRRINVPEIHCWRRCFKARGLTCQSTAKSEDKLPLTQRANVETTCGSNDVLKNNNGSIQIPKKKSAILMAYCGRGYYGMQRNVTRPDLPTIEGALVSALIEAQCIPEIFSLQMKLLKFQRCARTDKGVSALGQVVSLRLLTSCSDQKEKINLHLPPEIRVLDIKRVTKGFSSKIMCDGRSYSYLMPTFALSRAHSTPDSSFRLSREDFHHINKLLSFYKGTHNFHNFTSRKGAEDPSALRCMFDVSCSEPFVLHGTEFTHILVKGQSFMLYQIRKMVGLIIAVARGIIPSDFLPQCVQMEKVNIPPAPGLGLVLDCVHYNYYNRRYGGDGFHQALTWEESKPALAAFWEERIMPDIIEGELGDLSMCLWLDKVKRHNFLGCQNNQDF
ncbi:pseudouridylate synthase 1 homolog [Rhinophrynus dorsalis]